MVTSQPGSALATMEPPPSSASAAEALKHLRGVENQLQNEGFVVNKETLQRLEDAVKAIKELEEERKHTLELLEEETIKNCNLRVKVKTFPAIVMKEFEELVAAVHQSRFCKFNEMEVLLHETGTAIESMYSKQQLAEQRNHMLCEEQEQMWVTHKDDIDLLNQQLSTKHTINIEINELLNLRKEEEEEIDWQERAIEEVKITMAREADDFREKKAWLDKQIADLKSRLEARKCQLVDKKAEYEELTALLPGLQKEVADYSNTIADRRAELAELFKMIKQLIKEYENKKAEKEELIRKRTELQNEQTTMDSNFDDGGQELLQQIKEAEEELEAILRENQKLKNENNILSTQYQVLTDEEDRSCAERDKLALEFESLSNMLTEKLDRVEKRLVETQNIEAELARLDEIFLMTQNSYSREVGALEITLKKEGEKRAVLQDQLMDITTQYQKMVAEHNELLSSTKQKTEMNRKILADLTKENASLKKEILKSAETIKYLTEKLHEKELFYKKRDAAIEAEIKTLEEECNAKAKLLQEKEEQLKIDFPLSEQLQMELEEANANFTSQSDLFSELTEEQRTLTKSIERSLKEIAILKRMKIQARNELETKRGVAFEQLTRFTCSLKFLERDNYEVDRKRYILKAENDRLRAGIAYLREDISTMDSEAEFYRSKRQQTQRDVKDLHDLFVQRWLKDSCLHKMFLNYEHSIMKMLVEHIRRSKKRIAKLDYVHDGLQLNYEGMKSLLKSNSTTEP